MKQKLRKWMTGIVCMTVLVSGCGTAETTRHDEASDAEQYLSDNCEKAVVMFMNFPKRVLAEYIV